MSLVTLLAAAALALPSSAPQDPADLPPVVLPGDAPAPAARPAPELERGILPADTSPEARQAWELLKRATAPRDGTSKPVSAFDVRFEVRVRDDKARNEGDTRVVFVAPDLCRIDRKGRTLARGSKAGYWLRDGDQTFLLRGRDYAEDRRQIDELTSISNNFLALLDPASLRVRSARLLRAAPPDVPAELGVANQRTLIRPRELLWLEVVTPDFKLLPGSGFERPAGVEPTHRVSIGLEPGGGRPALALIEEEYSGLVDKDSALLVFLPLAYYRAIDGFDIPTVLHLFEREQDDRLGAFESRPRLEFGMRHPLTLRPRVRPEFFEPPG